MGTDSDHLSTDHSGTSGLDGDYSSDGTTLVEVIAGFEAAGFDSQFTPLEGGVIRCSSCRAESPAASFSCSGVRRTEGASDPADMVAVAALSCPACGAKGTLTAKFGPEASLEDADVLVELERQGQASKAADEVPLVEGAS